MTTRFRRGMAAVASAEGDLARFHDGAHQIAKLVRSTYGPQGRTVVASGAAGSSSPEILTSGAVIARRMIELDDRREDVGAMLLRGILWKLHERFGDGTTTAAIIFDKVLSEGIKASRAGLNTTRLRHFLIEQLDVVLDSLLSQRSPVATSTELEGIARSACVDAGLATKVAELQAILGVHGAIEVRTNQGSDLDFELIDVPFWPSALLDRALFEGHFGQRLDLTLCAVFVSDLALEDVSVAISLVEAARAKGSSSLLIIGKSISKQCVGLLHANSSEAFRIVAVRGPETDSVRQQLTLDDIAVMTGATVFRAGTGISPVRLSVDDLGSVRRGWVSLTHFGLFAGGGESIANQERIASIRQQFEERSGSERDFTSRRLSRLSGRAGILRVSGHSPRQIDERKAMAESAIRIMVGALDGGCVAGGGAALLEASRRLSAESSGPAELEDRLARQILVTALEEPSRVLALNHGANPSLAVAEAHCLERSSGRLATSIADVPDWSQQSISAVHKGTDYGSNSARSASPQSSPGRRYALNCLTGEVEDMIGVGILDSYECLSMAVRSAVEGAAQAMTVDTLILRKDPQRATAP